MDPYIKQLNELVHRIEILSEELDIANDLIESLLGTEVSELNEATLVEAKKWIQKAIKKEGSLRKTMKTKEGKTIPVSKLKKAAEKGGKTGKRARLALTLRKLNENGVVGQFNDSDDRGNDEKVATRTDSVAQKIGLMNSWGGNPVEYDVTTDEGLARALQHIQGVKTGMDAADSRSNISQSELDADKHNSQFLDQLTQMAKQRRLKVKHQGIGGQWTMDYGASK